ncbi:MAG: hypothetical protein AAFW84_16580 [Cyanobacteria bacterium J06635_15]
MEDLEEFCIALKSLGLTHVKMGISVLWYLDSSDSGYRATPGEIAKTLRDSGLAEPHSTKLGEAMLKSKLVQKSGAKHLKLKPTSRSEVREWLADILTPKAPTADQDAGFLPKAVWEGTRGYIQKIAEQVNGTYEFEFYDGCAVLARRLTETLLIEAYEAQGSGSSIKDSDNNYHMLGMIIDHAVNGGLPLGRDPKRDLPKIKTLGDRSAHNRRFVAKKADLDKIESAFRLIVEELLVIAGLR